MKTTLICITLASQLLSRLACAAGPAEYAAHEWGTFTSVQGGDGKLIEWSPLVSSKLPGFVYDRTRPSGHTGLAYSLGKGAFTAVQRMETPVIYFYSDQERSVDVTVRFPKGLITEWYPYAQGVGPSWAVQGKGDLAGAQGIMPPGLTMLPPAKAVRDSFIQWPNIRVLPAASGRSPERLLPTETSGSHYYAARATDANLIQIPAEDSSHSTETERFLFYRGLGGFETPLEVRCSQASESGITLRNRGKEDLAALFVLDVRGNQAAFIATGRLGAATERSLSRSSESTFQPLQKTADQLGLKLQEALVSQGLYEREAAAMVATWRDSWFEEPGLRVLYLLPRTWTDEILPVELKPQPRDLVRVMIGRAEVLTPEVQEAVRAQIVHYNVAEPKAAAEAVSAFRALHLGRFDEAAIRLALGPEPGRDLGDAGWKLLAASRAAAGNLARN